MDSVLHFDVLGAESQAEILLSIGDLGRGVLGAVIPRGVLFLLWKEPLLSRGWDTVWA